MLRAASFALAATLLTGACTVADAPSGAAVQEAARAAPERIGDLLGFPTEATPRTLPRDLAPVLEPARAAPLVPPARTCRTLPRDLRPVFEEENPTPTCGPHRAKTI